MAYTTPEELAEQFGKSRYWILQQCRAGRFPHQRVGIEYRFTAKQVEEIERSMERLVRSDDNGGRLPGVSPRSRSKYAKAPPA